MNVPLAPATVIAMSPSPLTRLARRLAGALLLCLGGVQSVAAQQQQPAADDGRFAPAAERAQQEADKVIKRILLNGTIQRRVGTPPAAEPPAAPAAKAAARPPAPPPQAKPAERPAPVAVDTRPPPAPAPAPAPIPRTAAAPIPVVKEASPAAEPVAAAAVAVAASTPPQGSTPQEDEPLVVLQEVEPEFPISIVRRQKKGNVVMRFVVQSDGTVAQINVVKTTNPFLSPSAIQALSQWKFQPLSRPQEATVEMGFDLAQQLSE